MDSLKAEHCILFIFLSLAQSLVPSECSLMFEKDAKRGGRKELTNRISVYARKMVPRRA